MQHRLKQGALYGAGEVFIMAASSSIDLLQSHASVQFSVKAPTAVITSTCLGKCRSSTGAYIKIRTDQRNHNLSEELIENFAWYLIKC